MAFIFVSNATNIVVFYICLNFFSLQVALSKWGVGVNCRSMILIAGFLLAKLPTGPSPLRKSLEEFSIYSHYICSDQIPMIHLLISGI